MKEVDFNADWERDWRTEWKAYQTYLDGYPSPPKPKRQLKRQRSYQEKEELEKKFCHLCQKLRCGFRSKQALLKNCAQEFLVFICFNCYRKSLKNFWFEYYKKINLPVGIPVPGMPKPVDNEQPKSGRPCKLKVRVEQALTEKKKRGRPRKNPSFQNLQF